MLSQAATQFHNLILYLEKKRKSYIHLINHDDKDELYPKHCVEFLVAFKENRFYCLFMIQTAHRETETETK